MIERQFVQKVGVPVISAPPETKWFSSDTESENSEGGKLVKLFDNMSSLERLVSCLSEFAGTACLVFVGCLGCTINAPLEQVAFTFGFAIMIGVQAFGHISGAHINPAVTVAAAALGHFPLINIPIYVAGQLLGSLTGFGLVKAIAKTKINDSALGVCSPAPNPDLSGFQIFLVEFLLTLVLVWVCCAIWDSRNAENTDSVSIKLGLTVAGLAMAGGAYSGANMNPARSFGPALLDGDWIYHWAYWSGPLTAGFVGGLLYRVLFAREPKLNETVPELGPTRENT
ncbi:unnamed protein product [Phyllotreta striolata]|uniref:Uncharacterized protein n=1 Tax=Phyllotreta striolata TaxID=444603 RepID=A0A9N9TXU2_PHYSR|nr:unnamed protein product [Phyllotreta striolata]